MSLSLAAAVSLLGSAMLSKAGLAFPAGGARDQLAILLAALVILLAMTGALLLALAGKALVDSLRQPHGPRREDPR